MLNLDARNPREQPWSHLLSTVVPSLSVSLRASRHIKTKQLSFVCVWM